MPKKIPMTTVQTLSVSLKNIIIIIIIIIILKYKDLTIEIQRMRNVKIKVIPVIIGATETNSKSFRKNVSNIPGNHEVKELQKTAILGTAYILRKVLTPRYNGVNAGTSDMSIMNSNTRIAATRCSLGAWFVSGI